MSASDFVATSALPARGRAQQRASVGVNWPRTLSFAAITAVSCALWLLIWLIATRL